MRLSSEQCFSLSPTSIFRVALQTKPNETLPILESAAKESLAHLLTTQSLKNEADIPDFQAILKSDQLPQSLRNLTAEHVNLLIKVRARVCCSGQELVC